MFKLNCRRRAPIRNGLKLPRLLCLYLQVVGTASHGQEGMELIQKTSHYYCADRYHHAHYGCHDV